MKVGDLVRVCYQEGTPAYLGIIIEVPWAGDEWSTYKMWCLPRGTEHILCPGKDDIEVLSEHI